MGKMGKPRQTWWASIKEVTAGRAAVYVACTIVQLWLFNDYSPIHKFRCVQLTIIESLMLTAFFVWGVSWVVNLTVRRIATRF